MIRLKYRLAICYTSLSNITIEVVGISLGRFHCYVKLPKGIGSYFYAQKHSNLQYQPVLLKIEMFTIKHVEFCFRRKRTSMGFQQEKRGYQTNQARTHADVLSTMCSVCCAWCWGLLRNIRKWRCCFGMCSNFKIKWAKWGCYLRLHIFWQLVHTG